MAPTQPDTASISPRARVACGTSSPAQALGALDRELRQSLRHSGESPLPPHPWGQTLRPPQPWGWPPAALARHLPPRPPARARLHPSVPTAAGPAPAHSRADSGSGCATAQLLPWGYEHLRQGPMWGVPGQGGRWPWGLQHGEEGVKHPPGTPPANPRKTKQSPAVQTVCSCWAGGPAGSWGASSRATNLVLDTVTLQSETRHNFSRADRPKSQRRRGEAATRLARPPLEPQAGLLV